jgi:hypothetical protein
MADIQIIGKGICPVYVVVREIPYEFCENVGVYLSEAEALDEFRSRYKESPTECFVIEEWCLNTQKMIRMWEWDTTEKYCGTICGTE